MPFRYNGSECCVYVALYRPSPKTLKTKKKDRNKEDECRQSAAFLISPKATMLPRLAHLELNYICLYHRHQGANSAHDN